jgi:hypothetical protein
MRLQVLNLLQRGSRVEGILKIELTQETESYEKTNTFRVSSSGSVIRGGLHWSLALGGGTQASSALSEAEPAGGADGVGEGEKIQASLTELSPVWLAFGLEFFYDSRHSGNDEQFQRHQG